MWTFTWGLTSPPPVHMRPPEPDTSPLHVDVINGWLLIFHDPSTTSTSPPTTPLSKIWGSQPPPLPGLTPLVHLNIFMLLILEHLRIITDKHRSNSFLVSSYFAIK